MNKKLAFITISFIFLSFNTFASENNCQNFKKFSLEYLKCHAKLTKDRTLSTCLNIIKDTKDFQNEEWTEEKEKMDNVKNKINKTKDKVLNK